ncbi:MAG: class I SAM-dependent methyltransferase [Candidatus Eisenbacteria bacterium]
MDIREHNARAWDAEVDRGNRWTVPVSPAEVAAARLGEWSIVLTPTRPVPRSWLPDIAGADVLCLASGGGQQGPILSAAGARVTVLDNSPRQLERDRTVAEREGLTLVTAQGDMADLSMFPAESFDLIVHPVSNCFVPDVRPVWREASRVLREGGALLSGFSNGFVYLFDEEAFQRGVYTIVHHLPYSDVRTLRPDELQSRLRQSLPLEFGHTLDDQIGGQIEAGFVVAGFYEDRDPREPLSQHVSLYAATRAIKDGRWGSERAGGFRSLAQRSADPNQECR